jgi:serine/threonine protein kinase
MMNPIFAIIGFSGGELVIMLIVAFLGMGLLAAGAVFLVWLYRRKNPNPPPIPQPPLAPPPVAATTVALPKCPRCRQPLPRNAPEGLCPECLARVAMDTETVPPTPPGATVNVNPQAEAAPGTRITPDVAQLASQFPQLEIIELLGRGGMGMVYKARQPRLDRLVALKILPVASMHHASFAERFEREAKALAKLNHPGIVTLYDFGQTPEYYYFIMEYVDGKNLRQLMEAKSLEPRQALELVTQICTALQFAHDESIIHRDIKPENILITKKGQVKIADFGLAKLLGGKPDTALTASQMIMGTLNYMAPEQREDAQKVDHRADIYSLGVVFYEMLTGEIPLGRFEPPSKRVGVDVRLDEVVLHALEREPDRRYQHVSEVKSNVETITSSMPRKTDARGTSGIFKLKPLPDFLPYVLKRFAIFAAAWVVIGFVVRLWLGDRSLSVSPHASPAMAFFYSIPILFCGLAADLKWSLFVLVAAFVLLAAEWLHTRAKRGLTFRQLPPSIQRRLSLWTSILIFGFAVATMTPPVMVFAFPGQTFSVRDYQKRQDQVTEWWFVPFSGDFEKLGFRLSFALEGNPANADSLPPCTLSLIVHRTNAEPATMKVILPGLRASYRFPTTNNWDNTFILDKDSLVEWMRKGAGLNPSAPKFQEEADQIYDLLKTYQLQPPETAKEFVNLGKADLRAFWFGGMQSDGFSYGGFEGGNFILVWIGLGVASLIYYIATVWMTKRFYGAALAEINSGRWTPPQKAPR